jgi:hypothetical protein
MSGKKVFEILKHLNLESLCIPAGVILASTIFQLQPIIRQALVGILMVWLGIESMTGFELWR